MVGIGRTDHGRRRGLPRGDAQGVVESSRARRSLDASGTSFAELCYCVAGTFDDPDDLQASCSKRLGELDAERGTAGNAVFYLSTPPQPFPTIVAGLGDAGLATEDGRALPPGRDREAVRARPGELARQLNDAGARGLRRAPDLPHRPLPGQGDGPEHPRVPLRERHLRAGLEPQLHRPRADHRGRVDRRRGPRPLLRGGRRAARHRAEPPAAGAVASWRWSRPRRSTPRRCATRRCKVLARRAGRMRRTSDVVRGQYAAGYDRRRAGARATARRRASRPTRDRDLRRRARLHIDNWRWAGTPFYLRTGKRLPKRVTEVAIQFKRVPHLPFSLRRAPSSSSRTCWCCASSRTRASRCASAPRCRRQRIQIRTVNMDFQYGTAFSAPTAEAYETLLLDAMRGDADELHAPGRGERVAGASSQPLLEAWQQQGGAPAPVRGRHVGPRRGRRAGRARRAQRWRRP